MIGGAQGFIDIKNEDALAGAPLQTAKLPFPSTNCVAHISAQGCS